MSIYSVKRGQNASAKSIDPGQPAQSAQADLGRYFFCHEAINYLNAVPLRE